MLGFPMAPRSHTSIIDVSRRYGHTGRGVNTGARQSCFAKPQRSKEYEGKNNIAKREQPYPTPEQRYVTVNGGLRRVDERGQIMTRFGKKAAKRAKKLRMRAVRAASKVRA